MNKTANADTVCPFYVSENANKISCEGLVLGTVCVTAFRTNIDKAMHQDMYCYCHKYKLCPVAKAVFGKYKGE
ncbi:MAG: hypothetical protein KH354_00925 [Clostridiales bacterium]|nr:hypothetical protein [Clostridiales bacterium]